MTDQQTRMYELLDTLRERTIKLDCLYQIEELLRNYDRDIEPVMKEAVEIIPKGLHCHDSCKVRITIDGIPYPSSLTTHPYTCALSADINVQDKTIGKLEVYYTLKMPEEEKEAFQKGEIRLINRIAERLGDFVRHSKLGSVIRQPTDSETQHPEERTNDWRIIVDMSRRMDRDLYIRISRKMLNLLCWNGIPEANDILKQISTDTVEDMEEISEGSNRPRQRRDDLDALDLKQEVFEIAARNLSDDEILNCIEKWMQEDRASFLIKTLINLDSSLGDIADAIRRFVHLAPEGIEFTEATMKGMSVALVRQFITDQLDYIKIAKNLVKIEDFYDIIKRLIFQVGSHGQVGGKSAGLFLAWLVLRKHALEDDDLKGIRVPKTWCITSDGLHNFMHFNNLEEVTEQKYKDIGLVRQEYSHIIQLFKNSQFTPEIIQGLSMALDDFGERPIIVRSSSLLEDRFGAAFSGKYKSLFLANQGTKTERLQALMDAIAEVYSSTFGPDPIEYREERGLIDFREEMGIILQEVVGTKIGKYFLPSFAGVAFSNNEFRWSPRIKRDDGLIRMVPGLGTRAVDRLSDDFPVLIAPGQPGLRVNVSRDEVIRYTPNKMDVLNLENNSFETVDVREFMRQHGDEIPGVMKMISVVRDDRIQQPSFMDLDFEKDDVVITFEGLIASSPFVHQMHKILKTLQETIGVPVDIEFAHDGEHFYLLQCRPQGTSPEHAPAPIPKDVPEEDIIFSANRHVSNGYVPDITHIVYVDPMKYAEVDDLDTLMEVGQAVNRLNKLLPKRQFILMGPGRWGSRGDIKLGVNVTYSDINNTAMLIEIARKKGNYVPDLSFGTHFFQDLVEAAIRYLPLYPDDENIFFNERFLSNTRNILPDILPEFEFLGDIIRVIDVPRVMTGKVLKVLMNADLDEAVGIIAPPSSTVPMAGKEQTYTQIQGSDDHWRWRSRMAEHISSQLDPARFGVKASYLFGSVKNATAGPSSDINLLIHFSGTDEQKKSLMQWFEGWSLCLDEMNFLRTGYRSKGLLDVHLISDKDIERRSSFAQKIDAVTDAAKELVLMGAD
ncbi:pyruvate, phosphate dikinase [bacterium]|nr:pyruvate, phosphate dikinase [bacterium]